VHRARKLSARGAGGVLPPGPTKRAAMLKAAAVPAWVTGFGFGLPCAYAIWYFADRGDVWTFLGFPTYGAGPFEDIGIETAVPLLWLFLLVCAAEVAAGWLLWQRRRLGAVLALALLPVEFAFWIGFALPFGPVAGLARTLLVLLGWPSLRRRRVRPAHTVTARHESAPPRPTRTSSPLRHYQGDDHR